MNDTPVCFASDPSNAGAPAPLLNGGRHCEEPFDAACGGAQDKLPLRRSDEAIQVGTPRPLDCFAALAMTVQTSLDLQGFSWDLKRR
jgi:hypothetical protein